MKATMIEAPTSVILIAFEPLKIAEDHDHNHCIHIPNQHLYCVYYWQYNYDAVQQPLMSLMLSINSSSMLTLITDNYVASNTCAQWYMYTQLESSTVCCFCSVGAHIESSSLQSCESCWGTVQEEKEYLHHVDYLHYY